MVYLLWATIVVLLLGTVVYIAFIIEFHISLRPGRVIYHASDLGEQGEHLEKIITKYVRNTEKYYLVEPGAGLAKVAEYLERRFPWKEVQAVELGPVILTIGKVRKWFRQMNVRYIHENILSFRYPHPAILYCYLTSELLDDLHQRGKFKNQLVISLTFAITKVQPTEEIPLKGWQGRLLVYDFRSK